MVTFQYFFPRAYPESRSSALGLLVARRRAKGPPLDCWVLLPLLAVTVTEVVPESRLIVASWMATAMALEKAPSILNLEVKTQAWLASFPAQCSSQDYLSCYVSVSWMLWHLLRLQCCYSSAVKGTICVPWFPMMSKRDSWQRCIEVFDQGKGGFGC